MRAAVPTAPITCVRRGAVGVAFLARKTAETPTESPRHDGVDDPPTRRRGARARGARRLRRRRRAAGRVCRRACSRSAPARNCARAAQRSSSPHHRSDDRGDGRSPQGRKHAPPSADAKPPFNWSRLIISYLLWSLLLLSGAHHLYLGRNRAALLSSVTCGGFVVGHVLDVLRMPGYVRRLAEAEREEGIEAAAAVAGAGSRARAAASRGGGGGRHQTPRQGRRLLFAPRPLRGPARAGAWVGLPSAACCPTPPPRRAASWLRAAGAAVAVWLASASAGGGLRPGPLAAAVGGVHALASGPLAPWLATHLPQMQPGSPALVAAVALANAPASLHERLGVAGARWKRLARPRRSWRSALGVILASTAFWMLVLASTRCCGSRCG